MLYAPLRGLVSEALRGARLPLWDPFEGLGKPLFAEGIHGVLHPFSLVVAFLAPGLGVDALIALWLISASLGAWVLARQMGATETGAVTAGFSFGLSGFVLGETGNLCYLAGAASIPWVLAAARHGARGGRGAVAILAAATACLALSGDVEALAFALPVGAILALEHGGRRGAIRAAAGELLGVGLAAIQLYPSWVHLGRTVRSLQLPGEFRAQWALAPIRLLELVAPGFFRGASGLRADPVYLALGGPSPVLRLPFSPAIFVGAPVLLLAAVGLRRHRAARVLGVTAGLLLWAALGQHLGAEEMLHWLPIVGGFRYAEKWLGPFTLMVAVLAGLGVDEVAERPLPKWARGALWGTLALSGTFALVLVAGPGLGRWILSSAGEAADLARARLGVGLLHCAAGLGVLAALFSSKARPAWFAGLALVQSAAAAPYALYVSRASDLGSPPTLTAEGPVRIETPITSALSSQGRDELARSERMLGELAYPTFNASARVDNVQAYTGLPGIRLDFLWEGLGGARWHGFRRFAATHALSPADAAPTPALEAAVRGAREVGVEGEVRIHELPHRPWVFFAEQATAEPDRARTFVDVQRRILNDDPTVVLQADRVPPLGPGRVFSAKRRPEEVEVDAEAVSDGLLVINDAYWPGWDADVDGRSVPIWPADFLVRAVPFPKGRHLLRMRYDPPEVGQGAAVSVIAMILLLLVSGWEVFSRAATREGGAG